MCRLKGNLTDKEIGMCGLSLKIYRLFPVNFSTILFFSMRKVFKKLYKSRYNKSHTDNGQ